MNFTLADTFLKIGSALASRSPDIIVRMDTRTTSPLLAHPLISGIPTVAFSTRLAEAGCIITASHNPEEYNGLKLFNKDGYSFTRLQ
ncbi:MAG: hypothetical protein WCB46_09475 [Methanoregula sp.]